MRLREGARAVIFDQADRILLVRFTFPDLSLWATPGGGLDPGETHEQAVARELGEEAGLDEVVLGSWVWTRTHMHPSLDGNWDGQRDRYFLVRTAAFEPAPRFTAEQLASEHVSAIRWWTQHELAASEELFAPRRLPELVAALLRDGPPGEPIDVGV
ncbi:MAG: NUDIX domain-containing protein [Actinomycetota bacterium]|nr:NUDIX domain-containing protein [Actinomycetota bacterium]